MNDFEYVLTLARGFAPARPVALTRCDVVELRRQTLNSGEHDAQADHFERKSSQSKAGGASGD